METKHLKKYKLVREYPGSPKLGTNAIYDNGNGYRIEGYGFVTLNTVENYSEFWEEIKGYPKIISFRSHGQIYDFPNGYDKQFDNKIFANQVLFEIYQVAVSENEVFTVGDRVIHNHKDGTKRHGNITRFTYKEPHMYVDVDYDKTSGYSFATIDTIEKHKQSLFTTEDRVDKYFGDMYYYIVVNSILANSWKAMIDRVDWENPSKPPLGQIQFDDRDKAEEWILNNKPIFSMKDIDDALECSEAIYVWDENLREIVKAREILFKQKLGI